MRPASGGARALLIALSLLLPASASGFSLDGLKAPGSGGDDPLVGRLVEDEAYLRHGAVTSMATCLAVADDPGATLLWKKDLSGKPSEDHALARWLAGQAGRFQSADAGPGGDRSFGTVLACAQIVAAWHATLPLPDGDTTLDDGRVKHGAVVLDLGTAGGGKTAIKPEPLVRLLTSTKLLPPAAYGGVVVKNARIDGTLLFYNLHLNHPLVFVGIDFAGGDYEKAFIDGNPIGNTAISIQHSRFSDHLAVLRSRLCGKVRVNDSSFQDTFLLADIVQRGRDCGALNPKEDALRIQGSRFAKTLNINGSLFGRFAMVGSDVDSFLMASNDFVGEFRVQDSDITSFESLGGSVSPFLAIKYNRIGSDLFIEGGPALESGEVPKSRSFEIVSNRIGGGLGLLDFRSAQIPALLNLRSNHVGNGSQLCLPHDWRGRIRLDGSSYAGTLSIGLEYPPGVDAPIDGRRPDPPCHGPFFIDQERAANPFAGNTYCLEVGDRVDRKVLVDLTATEIRTLRWHLPFNCTYRWSGFGLTYDLWMPPEGARPYFVDERERWHEAAFNAWRTTLAAFEPASLDRMSRYFADKGEHVASRDLQLEAKRLNYAPECSPSDNLWACLRQVIGNPDLSRSAYAAGPEAPGRSNEPLMERIWRGFKLVLLWPGGFGAKPERAILLLIGGAAFFALVYSAYCGWMWWRCSRLDAFLGRIRAHLPDGSGERANAPDTPTQTGAAALSRTIADIRAVIPRQSHPRTMEVVRRRLLPELAAVAEAGSELDRLRRKLLKLARDVGSTHVHGFSLFNTGQMPTRFTPLRYSIDTMIPVIDLHAYSNYYPEWGPMRGVTVFQHVLGWWWLTVFVASAAIL